MLPNRDDVLMKRVEGEFVKSYTPTTGWGNAVSMYMSLLGLRSFWAMNSAYWTGGEMLDMVRGGHDLTRSTTLLTYEQDAAISSLIPYAAFSSERYLYRADGAGLDILGTENYHHSTQRGLTMGTWINPRETPSTSVGILGKWNTAGSRSYLIYVGADLRPVATVSGDGTAGVEAKASAAQAIPLNTWSFVSMRFLPSSELAIYVNGRRTANTTSIPAAIFNSTARFEIGSFGNGSTASTWAHLQTFCYLGSAALQTYILHALYHHTRALFGV